MIIRYLGPLGLNIGPLSSPMLFFFFFLGWGGGPYYKFSKIDPKSPTQPFVPTPMYVTNDSSAEYRGLNPQNGVFRGAFH